LIDSKLERRTGMKRKLGMIMVLLAAVALMVAIACGSAATAPLPT